MQRGALKVYAVDTGYGVLDWKLRKDSRVIVMERTNAMHLELLEKVDFVTIDVAWTKQEKILPAARKILREPGQIVTLIKPHYEAAAAQLRKGVLPEGNIPAVIESVKADMQKAGFDVLATVFSPIKGAKGNIEMLAHLRPSLCR